jgi:hypothetical protein
MTAKDFYLYHKSLFDNWIYGDIVQVWTDAVGYTCIKYQSGNWFHYRVSNGHIMFW